MGATTNKVCARELYPEGPGWRPGYRSVHFPMKTERVFELALTNPRHLPGLTGVIPQRLIEVVAMEPMQRWEVGVVLLRIRGKVYAVRVCESGECAVLREYPMFAKDLQA